MRCRRYIYFIDVIKKHDIHMLSISDDAIITVITKKGEEFILPMNKENIQAINDYTGSSIEYKELAHELHGE